MILVSGEVIQGVLSGAITTTQPDFVAAYVDHTTTTATPAGNGGTLNSATDVEFVGAPGASTQRQVTYLSVFNRDTASITLTIKHDTSGTERTIWKGTLYTGECVCYTPQSGWVSIDTYGSVKQCSAIIMPQPIPRPFIGVDAANLTAVKTLTSGSTFAYYLGRAEFAYTSVVLRVRVTTAMATITWGEVGVASAPAITMAGNASLTRLGYTDVSATYNSTGQKTTTVTVTGVVPGMHLWAMFGNSATTAAILRGALADDLQSGFFQAAAATRPSTMASATAFTVEGATVVPIWGTWLGS